MGAQTTARYAVHCGLPPRWRQQWRWRQHGSHQLSSWTLNPGSLRKRRIVGHQQLPPLQRPAAQQISRCHHDAAPFAVGGASGGARQRPLSARPQHTRWLPASSAGQAASPQLARQEVLRQRSSQRLARRVKHNELSICTEDGTIGAMRHRRLPLIQVQLPYHAVGTNSDTLAEWRPAQGRHDHGHPPTNPHRGAGRL